MENNKRREDTRKTEDGRQKTDTKTAVLSREKKFTKDGRRKTGDGCSKKKEIYKRRKTEDGFPSTFLLVTLKLFHTLGWSEKVVRYGPLNIS